MAVAFVKKSTRAAFGGGSSAAPSLASVSAGNLVVLVVGASRGDTAATAIAAPSGWTAAQNPAGPTIAGSPNYTPVAGIFYKLSSAGGTESATVSLPSGSYGWAQIAEFSGGPFTFTAAQSANGVFNTTATSRATGTTGANSISDAVVIAVGHPEDTIGSVSALGTPATWTSIDLEATNSAEVAWSADYKILSSTGTQSATHSWTTNAYYSGVIGIFEGPGGAAAYELTVDPASYSLTAAAETATATRALTISPASYALTAANVNLAVGRAVNFAPASYTLTAAAETLTATRTLSIDPASYSLTNSAVTLSVGRVVSVDPVVYTLTASAETLTVARQLNIAPAAYALTAADVTLEHVTANPVLSVDPVSYVLSLPDVSLEYGAVSTASTEQLSYSVPSKKRERRYNYDYSSPKVAEVAEPAKAPVKAVKKAKKSIPADMVEMLGLIEASENVTAQVLSEQTAMRAAEQRQIEEEQEMMAVIACCL
jgi:hypothetical protein